MRGGKRFVVVEGSRKSFETCCVHGQEYWETCHFDVIIPLAFHLLCSAGLAKWPAWSVEPIASKAVLEDAVGNEAAWEGFVPVGERSEDIQPTNGLRC